MKILHTVESYNPTVSGMQEVVSQLSQRLVEKGHDVTVVTTKNKNRGEKIINGVKIVEFDITGNFVRGLRGEVNEYKKFLLASDFDVVTNFAAQQWATDIALPILHRIKGKKVFVPTGFSGFYDPAYADYFQQMKSWIKGYDMNFFLSDDYRDVNFAKDLGVSNRLLVPNAADEREFLSDSKIDIKSVLGIPRDHFVIFHVGSHTGQKGHKEAIAAFEKANIKKATFVLCGNSFGGGCSGFCELEGAEFNKRQENIKAEKKLIVKFLSREETVAAYKQSDLFLFPSNIECSPITLFESMAARLPFLVTDVGNSKEIINWSGGGLLIKTFIDRSTGNSLGDIQDIVSNLEVLYSDPDKRRNLADSGYRAWKERFTWERVAETYEREYKKLINTKSAKKKASTSLDIVILAQNNEQNIEKTINNLKQQSIPGRRIFLLDIESKDKTISIASKHIPEENILSSPSSQYIQSKNLIIDRLKSEYCIFISAEKTDIDESFIDDYLSQARITDVDNLGLIYKNYKLMEQNKPLVDRFSMLELGTDFRGKIYHKLLKSNRIASVSNGILIKTEIFERVGRFDSSLGSTADWDLILRISKEYGIDFIPEYALLLQNAEYKPFLWYDYNAFRDKVMFYNKWVKDLSDKDILKVWAHFLSWIVLLGYPNLDLLKITNDLLEKDAKKALFPITLGSVKGYMLVSLIARFIKSIIIMIRDTLKSLVHLLAQLKSIIFLR